MTQNKFVAQAKRVSIRKFTCTYRKLITFESEVSFESLNSVFLLEYFPCPQVKCNRQISSIHHDYIINCLNSFICLTNSFISFINLVKRLNYVSSFNANYLQEFVKTFLHLHFSLHFLTSMTKKLVRPIKGRIEIYSQRWTRRILEIKFFDVLI